MPSIVIFQHKSLLKNCLDFNLKNICYLSSLLFCIFKINKKKRWKRNILTKHEVENEKKLREGNWGIIFNVTCKKNHRPFFVFVLNCVLYVKVFLYLNLWNFRFSITECFYFCDKYVRKWLTNIDIRSFSLSPWVNFTNIL